jgi:hypothetical protein
VAGGVNCSKPLDADAGVALGRVQIGVAEHLGDVSDVGPALETGNKRCFNRVE